MKKSEMVNVFSHISGVLLMCIATVILIYTARSKPVFVVSVIIYGISSIVLFSASALYHFKKKQENEKSIWRKIDHISIYLMIAGTYTPLCIMAISGVWSITILSIQWGLALSGLLFEFLPIKKPRWLTTGIYLLMGWIVVAAIVPIYRSVDQLSFTLLVAGGFVYSVGALVYAVKKPNLIPVILGFHEIFHFMILLANGIFIVMIYNIMIQKL
jgi:hemolysin III